MLIQINDHGDNRKFNFITETAARSAFDVLIGSDFTDALPVGNFKFVARPRVFVTGCPTLDTSRDALA
jgi:hypothetical protein